MIVSGITTAHHCFTNCRKHQRKQSGQHQVNINDNSDKRHVKVGDAAPGNRSKQHK